MPDWLPAALAYIPAWLDYQMRQSEQPGCVVAVAHRGEVLLEQAFGHADLARREALTPRHRFRVASHSKAFTAAAILKLREQDRLRLDNPAGQHVDGLHPEVAQATLAQLLSHSAGLFRDGEDSGYWSDDAPFSDEARIRADLTLPPAITPNARFKYSNHGFALAGLVIEAVTGEPYCQWVQREIVDAAGLTETLPEYTASITAMARGHSLKQPLGYRVVFPGEASTNALAAATGFVSTAADLARFFGQLAPDAATSVLSPASRREMARPRWHDEYTATPTSYGLGTISGKSELGDWFGHSGGFQGYLTRTVVAPSREISVSVLTNAADGLCWPWLDGVLHILQVFAASGAPQAEVADWRGRWWNAWGPIDLVPAGDKVLVAMPNLFKPLEKAAELSITGPDHGRIALAGGFRSHGEPVRRERDPAGTVRAVWLASGRLIDEATHADALASRYVAAG